MPEATTPDVSTLLANRRRILVTGGASFIGGAVVRLLPAESDAQVFNLDKIGYASDLTSLEVLPQVEARHQLLKVGLTDAAATAAAVQQADPDLVLNLAAENHVDRSIEGPGAFIDSNVTGTFHLLQAVRWYVKHQGWFEQVRKQSGDRDGRLGVLAGAACSAIWRAQLAARNRTNIHI